MKNDKIIEDNTTIPVKKSTRMLLENIKGQRTWDEFALSFLESKHGIRSIIVSMDSEKFDSILKTTKIVYSLKMIEKESIEDTIILALDTLSAGLEKEMSAHKTEGK